MNQNDKPLRQRRRERLERQARERGYVGPWPPRWPVIETAEQFEAVLGKLEAGERRASFVHLLGRRLVQLRGQLKPEHFARLAAAIRGVILDPATAPRVRIRAVQAVARPGCDAAALMARRRSPRLDEAERDYLLECLWTFYCQFSDDDLRRFVMALDGLLTHGQFWTRIRALRTLLTLKFRGMSFQLDWERATPTWTPPPLDPAELAQAQAELDAMRAEIAEELATATSE